MSEKMYINLFKLDDMNIVVAGAGLIGSAIIEGLAQAGAKVIIGEVDEKKGKKLESDLIKENLNVIYRKLDISDENSVNEFFDFCNKEINVIHGWVNTAYPRTENWGKKDIGEFIFFKKNIEMHLGGYYITSIKIAEKMKSQGFGSIVNFGSIYGVNAPKFSIYKNSDLKMPIDYAVIKGGINMLTKYISTYYGKYNVRANVLAPGGVFDNQPENFVKNYIENVPLKRMANVKDIVGPVIFLISKASSYITGQIILVDGGWTSW